MIYIRTSQQHHSEKHKYWWRKINWYFIGGNGSWVFYCWHLHHTFLTLFPRIKKTLEIWQIPELCKAFKHGWQVCSNSITVACWKVILVLECLQRKNKTIFWIQKHSCRFSEIWESFSRMLIIRKTFSQRNRRAIYGGALLGIS